MRNQRSEATSRGGN